MGCAYQNLLSKDKKEKLKEPPTGWSVRPEEDIDQHLYLPGISTEGFFPPAWVGRVKLKVVAATPTVVAILSRQLDTVINKAQAKPDKLQATVQTSNQSNLLKIPNSSSINVMITL